MNSLFIFDFDDTLALTNSHVIINKTKRLNSREFAKYRSSPQDELDFSEFMDVKDGSLIQSTVQGMESAIRQDGIENVFIVTARSAAGPVHKFLKSKGIQVPRIIATSGSEGKARWLINQLVNNDYDRVVVYEDCRKNIAMLEEVVETYNEQTGNNVLYSPVCVVTLEEAMKKKRNKIFEIRKIVRSIILNEEVLNIIQSPYEDVEDYNILANYALTNDIKGALSDPALRYYIEKNEMGWVIDAARGWFGHVGEEGYNMPAPAGWDPDAAWDFLENLENASYKKYAKDAKARIKADPDKGWLKFLGNEFTSYIEPGDLEGIKWKEYKRYIRLSPPPSISHGIGEINISKENFRYSKTPGDWDDFKDFLSRRTAGDLGRRKRRPKPMTPYYD